MLSKRPISSTGAFCRIGVTQKSGLRTIEFNHNQKATEGPIIKQNDLWLRADIDSRKPPEATFSYSLDGKAFIPMGDAFTFGWSNYRGERIALYSFNPDGESGYVDVDWLHYTY